MCGSHLRTARKFEKFLSKEGVRLPPLFSLRHRGAKEALRKREKKYEKYELTDETKKAYGVTLYRIKALRSFGSVSAGDLGGYVQREDNLSHEGDAWVCGTADYIYDNPELLEETK